MTGIVELNGESVLAMPVTDCGEPLVDIGVASDLLFGEPPEFPETAPDYRFVRQGVLDRLEQAQAVLPPGLYLRLYEGFRSTAVQARIFEGQLARTTAMNPGLSSEQCYLEACKLASPLRKFDGTEIIPPHSTGGAIDVEIVDAHGAVIDFGMEAKDWVSVEPALCATDYPGLTPKAHSNRQLLVEVLQGVGFVNYPREWWHFSYGDKYWAFVSGTSGALYGRVER